MILLSFLTLDLILSCLYFASDGDNANIGTGLVGAPACGDVMKLQIRLIKEEISLTRVLKLLVVVLQ